MSKFNTISSELNTLKSTLEALLRHIEKHKRSFPSEPIGCCKQR